MATAMANNGKPLVRPIHTENNKFDDLTLIWLDEQVNSSADCLHTKGRLRLIVNILKTFNDINTCLVYIQSSDDDEHICVVVSGALCDAFIPVIVNQPQIACIAIYCSDERRYHDDVSNISHQSSRVLGIFVEIDPLLNALNERVTILRNSLSSVSSFAYQFNDKQQKSVKDLSQENATFMWFQLLIHTLFRLPRTDNARTKMIQECERQYDGNQAQLTKIKEFAEKYQPTDAVSWYTRDSFVYRIINRALRTQDIDVILTFYPFIADLHDQLSVLHTNFLDLGPAPVLIVYRGQRIHSNELNKVIGNVGQLLSMNSFFSTGLDRALARRFASGSNQVTDDLVSIVYEVHIETEVPAAPFSNVGEHSLFPGEEEFLFSVGAVFRVESAQEVTDELGRFWLVTVRLVDEHHEQELNDLFEHLKSQIDETSSLLILAGFLFQMDNMTAAERYYKLLRDELPKDHPDQPIVLNNLGQIASKNNRTEDALDLYKQALHEYAGDTVPRPYLTAITYGNIATIHYHSGNFDRAEDGFRKVLELQETSLAPDHELFITTRSNLGSIFQSQGKLQEALEQFQEALKLCHRVFQTENHPTRGIIEGNIGNIYDALGNVNGAIASFERSLAIQKRCLPSGHYSLVTSHANLGHMYIESGNYAAALNHLESALTIEKQADHGSHKDPVSLSNILDGFSLVYLRQNKPIQALMYCNQALKILPADHPQRASVYRQLGAIYREVGAYKVAIEAYRKAIALSGDNEINMAEHLHSLGLVQADQKEHGQAIDSFKSALEIRKRLLPPAHPAIAKLYNEMGGVFLATDLCQEALDHFQQARTLEVESLPENHIETARTLNNIGVTLYKLDRLQEALTFVNQAVEIARKILADTDSLRIMFQNTAAIIQKRVETGSCEGVSVAVT